MVKGEQQLTSSCRFSIIKDRQKWKNAQNTQKQASNVDYAMCIVLCSKMAQNRKESPCKMRRLYNFSCSTHFNPFYFSVASFSCCYQISKQTSWTMKQKWKDSLHYKGNSPSTGRRSKPLNSQKQPFNRWTYLRWRKYEVERQRTE